MDMLLVSVLVGLLMLSLGVSIVYYRQKEQLRQDLWASVSSAQVKDEQYMVMKADVQRVLAAHGADKAELLDFRLKHQALEVDLASVQQHLKIKVEILSKTEGHITVLQDKLEQCHIQNTAQQTSLATLRAESQKEKQSSAEKLLLLEDAKHKLSQEFKLLAQKIFEEKEKKMTASSQVTLDAVLKPMQHELSSFRQRIEQVHKEDVEARGSLDRHLEHLKLLNQQMSQDTLNLTQALKGDNKAQGNWGEMILEKLLESSGLREGYEFKREKTFRNDENNLQKPDVIIYMPGDKQVIIDAKVSLTDYERAVSCHDKEQRKGFVQAHTLSMKKQIKTLTDKRYDHLEGVHSPDYVLMFVPIEGAYLMAIEADRTIFEDAFHRNIAVVTPSTLYATLKLIEQLWRYEQQSSNVAKLTKQAGNLHDKFVGFIGSFEDIDKHLGQAQKAYEIALGQLKNGRGNLVNQVKTLADLSGKAKKEIPAHLLNDEQHDDAS